MSLDKAIASGKEYRKPYYDSKAFDGSCRNHGGCPACENKRKYKILKRLGDKENARYFYVPR